MAAHLYAASVIKMLHVLKGECGKGGAGMQGEGQVSKGEGKSLLANNEICSC